MKATKDENGPKKKTTMMAPERETKTEKPSPKSRLNHSVRHEEKQKMDPTNHHAPINRMSPKLTLSRVSWMDVMLHNINCSLSANRDLGLVLSLSIKSPVGSKLTELA